jgi:hypothetical protein
MALRVDTWYAAIGPAADSNLTLAGYWYAFVSLSLFRFVIYRWYFRLILWYIFLWRVSRLSLRMNSLHPDRAGGLGFIDNSVFAFTAVLLGHTTVLSGVIGGRIWHEGMKLPTFQMEIAGEVALLMVLVLVPLTFFLLPLVRGKRAGLREYGLLAMQYVDGFGEKWLSGARTNSEPLVGSADIQSLADLAGAHDVLREMRVFPFSRQSFITLAVVIALPYLPLTLTMIPLEEMVRRVLTKLL